MQYLCGFVDVKTKWVMVLYSVPQNGILLRVSALLLDAFLTPALTKGSCKEIWQDLRKNGANPYISRFPLLSYKDL